MGEPIREALEAMEQALQNLAQTNTAYNKLHDIDAKLQAILDKLDELLVAFQSS